MELWQNGQLVATLTTNSEGRYLFTGLQPGTYEVRVNDVLGVLNGYDPTELGLPGVDGNNQALPYTVTLVNGAMINLTADFGYLPPVRQTAVSFSRQAVMGHSAELLFVSLFFVVLSGTSVFVTTLQRRKNF